MEKREHFKIDDIVRWVLVGIISREDAYTNMSISSISLDQPVTSLESWLTIVEEAKLREAELQETWKLVVVLSIDQIIRGDMVGRIRLARPPRKCSNCETMTCCLWKNEETKKLLNYCLDCQKQMFHGWPEVSDIPRSSMINDHRNIILQKCSTRHEIHTMHSLLTGDEKEEPISKKRRIQD